MHETMSKFKSTYENNSRISGGVGNLSRQDKQSRLSIDVWGHASAPEDTKEVINNIRKFLNDEFTVWEYLKMAWNKLWKS